MKRVVVASSLTLVIGLMSACEEEKPPPPPVVPEMPTLTEVLPAGPANDNNPHVKGTAPAGTTVSLYGNSSCSTAELATGTAEAFAAEGLAVEVQDNSTSTFFAIATSGEGVSSPCSDTSVSYVEDSAAPATPAAPVVTPVGPANNNTPTLSGTVEVGSTVTVHKEAACTDAAVAQGAAGEGGAYSLQVTVADDSVSTFYVRATDVSGNASACSPGVSYTEDSTAPEAPVFNPGYPVSPSNDNVPEFRGTAEAGSTVRLYTDAACATSAVAVGSASDFGSSGLQFTVADNSTTTVYATATDRVGNVSPCTTEGVTYVEDSSPPPPATLSAINPVGPANNRAPVVTGTAEAGTSVRIFPGPGCTTLVGQGTAEELATGITLSLPDNTTLTLYVTTEDTAGNRSTCTASSITYTVDSTPPTPPSFLGSTPLSPANNNAPLIRGRAPGAVLVHLYRDAECTGEITGSGSATDFEGSGLSVLADDNTTTRYYGRSEDVAGNISDCSPTSLAYTEDSLPPDPPQILGTQPASPANDNQPRVAGSAEVGATVRIFTDSNCTVQVSQGASAAFASTGLRVDPPVGDDSTTQFHANATDLAGNTSACTATGYTYVEDSIAPAAADVAAVSPGGPANENNPVVTGSAEALSVVDLFDNANCTGTPIASGTAEEFSTSGIAAAVADDSITTIHARATDVAANPGPCSATYVTYEEDSTPPAPPAFTDLQPALAANNENNPLLSGTGEADTTLRVYSDDTCVTFLGETMVAVDGTWSLTLTVDDDSTTALHVTATDRSANSSPCTYLATYVEDSTPPSPPTITSTFPPSPANDSAPDVNGTAEPGVTVSVYADASCAGTPHTTVADDNGAFTILDVAVTGDGTHPLRATATDLAGNASPCSPTGIDYVLDSTLDPIFVITAAVPASPSTSLTPEIAGDTVPNAMVSLFSDAQCTTPLLPATDGGPGYVRADDQGTFTVTVLPLAANAATPFYARIADDAGNVLPCVASSPAFVYQHDDQPPTAGGAVVRDGLGLDRAYSSSGTEVALNWDAFTDAVGVSTYEVSLGTNATCTALVAAWQAVGNTLSATLTGLNLSHAGVYYTCVRARDQAGNTSAPVASDGFTVDLTNPTVPGNATATAGNRQASLSWTASTDTGSGVDHYEIAYCVQQGGPCQPADPPQITGITGNSVVIKGLDNCVTYDFVVRAVDRAANTSDYSARASALTTLPLVTNLKTVVGPGTLELSWEEANHASDYEVCYSNGANACQGTVVSTGGATAKRLVGLPLTTAKVSVRPLDDTCVGPALADTNVLFPSLAEREIGGLAAPVLLAADINVDGYVDLISAYSGVVIIANGVSATTANYDVIASFSGADEFGAAVAIVGDLDDDGAADIVVGSPAYNGNDGRVDAFSMATGRVLWTAYGDIGSRLGSSLAAVGDSTVDGDALADVVAGAPGVAGNNGYAAFLAGADGAEIARVNGPSSGRLGTRAATAGDVNGDGVGDAIVGAPEYDSGRGQALVLSGADHAVLHTLNGGTAGDRFGDAVAGSGDTNGDGLADVVVGAPYVTVNNISGAGRATVYSGADGATLFVVDGTTADEHTGAAVSSAGDVDADGNMDVAVGSPDADRRLLSRTGTVGVYSGVNGRLLYRTDGRGGGDRLGAVLTTGDLDGDGNSDTLATAPGSGSVYGLLPNGELGMYHGDAPRPLAEQGYGGLPLVYAAVGATETFSAVGPNTAGATYSVLSSNSGSPTMAGAVYAPGAIAGRVDTLRVTDALGRTRDKRVLALDHTVTSTLTGGAASDAFGQVIRSVGDLDLDGIVDFVVSAPKYGASNSGAVYAYSGRDASLLWTAYGDSNDSTYGTAVAGLGDVNDDGLRDVAVGQYGTGKVFIYGGDGATLGTIVGPAGTQFGFALAGVSDFNGDQIPDILVGAPEHLGGVGAIHIYSPDGTALYFKEGLYGPPAANDRGNAHFGFSVASLGDLTLDGLDELLVGAPDADLVAQGLNKAGAIYVIDPANIALAPADRVELKGTTAGENFGAAVTALGDHDANVVPDIAVGAPGASPNGVADSGQVKTVAVNVTITETTVTISLSTVLTLNGTVLLGNFGNRVSGVGDVNGDGRDDILISEPGTSTAYVYSGQTGTRLYAKSGGAADLFGSALEALGDVNGDGRPDFVVGAALADAQGGLTDAGAAYIFASVPPPTPLARPVGLGIAAPAWDTVQLTWNDVTSGETGFRVEYRAPAGTWATLDTVNANSTNLTAAGLSGNTDYLFRIKAYNSYVDSLWSPLISVRTPPAPPPPNHAQGEFPPSTTDPGDTTPLGIIQTQPGNNTSGNVSTAPVSIFFNDEIDPTTITGASLVVLHVETGNTLLGEVSGTLSTAGNSILHFHVAGGLPAPATIQVTLPSDDGIRDNGGNTLSSDYTFTFTTIAPPPPPESLSWETGTLVGWISTGDTAVLSSPQGNLSAPAGTYFAAIIHRPGLRRTAPGRQVQHAGQWPHSHSGRER
ncbi:MAG: Ig-like domain-containing protein [Myxococcota bacterium]